MAETTDGVSRTSNWALGAGIGFFILMALFWLAIFSGVFNHRNPDALYDTAWVAKAKQICTPASNAISNLPNASTSKTPADRSKLLDRGSAILEPMIAKLEALEQPKRASDRKIVTGFLSDWRVYIADRHRYSTELLHNPKAQPLFTEVHGGWSTDAIDAMANANNIPECGSPQDM